ncbi:NAD(P)/FAD-dependent oxidoreductase [Saccharopolyspora spinosporotrichia]|uniref:NAD(P)/FAD-dependent oxidoreductase n=1 Tax=Saccharopolyspora erythraea TaxID=1836 RepID=UPI001E3B3B8A|nr:FAD-dependent oxidoreductase [Saccharopolyspora erythraea]
MRPGRRGQDVHFCPYCHGYEVRDSALGVIGGEDRAFSLRQAQLIRQWSDDVVFFPHRIDLEAQEREQLVARGVRIVDGEVTRIVSDETGVRGVELAEGPMIRRAALFVGPRFVPSDELLTALGCELNDEGWVATDRTGRTSIDGVWAPGNVVDHTAQLINAAAAGSAAAIALNNHYLVAADVEKALNGHTEPAPAN